MTKRDRLIAARLPDANQMLAQADGVVIAAGAGMGVESGLPAFRGKQGFWRAYPHFKTKGLSFQHVASPRLFVSAPQLAWGFYGHRLNLYRHAEPHLGYRQLLGFSRTLENGAFVFTSNVDGHFIKAGFSDQRLVECHGAIERLQCSAPCSTAISLADMLRPVVSSDSGEWLGQLPLCPVCRLQLLRPNVLMFDDHAWIRSVVELQEARFSSWLAKCRRPLVLEIGAGVSVDYLRRRMDTLRLPTIRVNPVHVGKPRIGTALPMTAMEGIAALLA